MKRNPSDSVTIVDVLRHGECEGGEIYRGSTDVALNDRGWQQMHNAVAAACETADEPFPWDLIVASPLQRCRHFAGELAQKHDTSLVIEDDLREMNFGDWEGKPLLEVHERYPDEVKAFYKDPENNTPSNGEALPIVQQRVAEVFWRQIEKNGDKRLLFVQHGVTIRALIVALLGLPTAKLVGFEIPYACHVQFKVYSGKFGRRVVLSQLK